MYLEKLEIQGFKSFANKNKLIFPGLISGGKRGLTSVVGPNGSGKSNIADAIRWVLGEQSLKTLRGKKSEDVIFSGSDQKNQLSMAEVSLILNNVDKESLRVFEEIKVDGEEIKEELDFDKIREFLNADEIIITRRIYRNGDSEYLINNKRVRLADIQMLLAKASVGQKTYSVIGQGMVENFLNTNASERKDFFDEATGVKQFQIKRESSLNKLEGSYENLQQVEMLLSEIRPRLKSLTRQVEKLKRRSEIEADLVHNQFNYYNFLYQEANNKLEKSNAKFLELEKIKIDREEKLAKLNEELNAIRTTNNFQEINILQPQLKELETEKNQLLRQLAKLQAELEVQLESQGQFDVSWLNNKYGELASESEKITSELVVLKNSQNDSSEKIYQEELTNIEKEINRAYEVRREIEKKETVKNQYLKQITKLEATLEANLEAQGQFDVSWLNNKREELSLELESLNKEIEQLQKENNRDNENTLREKLNQLFDHLSLLNKEVETIKNELKKPGVAKNNREEISRIIEEFLNQLESIKKEADLEKVKKMVEAAKNNFQDQIREYLADENADKLNRIKEIQDDIIASSDKRQAINNQLNEERLRLSSISERLRLLQDKKTQSAREIADLEVKIAKSQIKFDATAIETEKAELLKLINISETEISLLWPQSQTRDLQEKKQVTQNKINENRLKMSSARERLRLLQEKGQQIDREMAEIKVKIAKSQIKFDATAIETEKTEINKKLEKINTEIKGLEEKINDLNQAKEKEKSQMFDLQRRLQESQSEITSLMAELNDLRIESARQETKLEDLENNIRNDELSISEIKNHKITEEIIDTAKWHKRLTECKNQLELIGGIDPETEKEFIETKERFDFLSNQTNDLNSAVKSLEKIISELDINIKDRFDHEFKIISEKFSEYFKILFNGGTAKIFKIAEEEKTPPDEPEIAQANPSSDSLKKIKILKKRNALGLSGIEIQATPPGKKIQTISMLSGGERALTAIALICAIISANPSPFVVLDEVDAALDEANSERLAQILDDLSDKTQFIVITHNRASMKRANVLYGVTMQSDGVSKLLSVKLEEVSSRQDLA
ncbi:MAG: AAA family ATPase [Candidatus Falkowbacteria bacterium]